MKKLTIPFVQHLIDQHISAEISVFKMVELLNEEVQKTDLKHCMMDVFDTGNLEHAMIRIGKINLPLHENDLTLPFNNELAHPFNINPQFAEPLIFTCPPRFEEPVLFIKKRKGHDSPYRFHK